MKKKTRAEKKIVPNSILTDKNLKKSWFVVYGATVLFYSPKHAVSKPQ